MTLLVPVSDVRTYLDLNDPNDGSTKYNDQTIGSNIAMAQSQLEFAVGRYIVPRTFTVDAPFLYTTSNRQQVPIPGFRIFTAVARSGAELLPNSGYWAVPDAQQTGVFTGMAFRAATGPDFWPGNPGTPYGPWITNPLWFDQAADSPFFPTNVGGAYFLTSLPNDLTIVGEAGYDPTFPPDIAPGPPSIALLAIRALAAWLTLRPASILADQAITPAGGVLTYSSSPAEVRDFIAAFRGGQPMMTSVG